MLQGLSGADDVEDMKDRMQGSEMDMQNKMLGNLNSMFSQGISNSLTLLGRCCENCGARVL